MFKKYSQSGFTLIEMIVSLGVFSIVVTTAVGAILVMITTNQRLQGEQSVMSNLAFALDNMTREIRTGSYFYCVEDADDIGGVNHEELGTTTADCTGNGVGNTGIGVSFMEGGESLTGSSDERVSYYFDSGDTSSLKRQVGGGSPENIVSGGVLIQDATFVVTGSDQLDVGNDTEQPTVTIYIQAVSEQDTSPTPKVYHLQTTITQRILDL